MSRAFIEGQYAGLWVFAYMESVIRFGAALLMSHTQSISSGMSHPTLSHSRFNWDWKCRCTWIVWKCLSDRNVGGDRLYAIWAPPKYIEERIASYQRSSSWLRRTFEWFCIARHLDPSEARFANGSFSGECITVCYWWVPTGWVHVEDESKHHSSDKSWNYVPPPQRK